MGRPDELARLAGLYGVEARHEPAPGRPAEAPRATLVAVLAALGVDAGTPPAVQRALERRERELAARLLPPCTVVTAGTAPRPDVPEDTALTVWLEDGDTAGDLSALPSGHHRLHARTADGRTADRPLIVVPARAPQPPRGYGFMVQLHSLLSARSWGMGDLGDLADLAAWAGRSLGADFLLVNPLHSAVPSGGTADPSPYRPSSRRFPDPVHLRVEDVPEYAYLAPHDRARAQELLVRAAGLRTAVLDDDDLIDRDAVRTLKHAALELVRKVPLSPGRRAAYVDFLAEQGQALEDHATWSALAERHGPDARSWPPGLDDPRSARTARARSAALDRIDFHSWLTWLTDAQLGTARTAAARRRDGRRHRARPRGRRPPRRLRRVVPAARCWRPACRSARRRTPSTPADRTGDCRRGAPTAWPPPATPPTATCCAALLRQAGGLRIDHVSGLFRLWWVPHGRPPTEGVHVRQDAEAMLGVLALEAHRAGAVVIGEDLGTVGEPGARDGSPTTGSSAPPCCGSSGRTRAGPACRPARPTAGRCRPSAGGPACWPPPPPTTCPAPLSRLSGEHVGLRHRLGLLPGPLADEQAADAADTAEWLALLGCLGLLPEGPGDPEGVIKAVHRFLLRTPARMIGVWLPDAIGDRRPQNLPGTSDQLPQLAAARSPTRPAPRSPWRTSPPHRGCTPWSTSCAADSPTPADARGRLGGGRAGPRARGVRGASLRWGRGQQECPARRHPRGRDDAHAAALARRLRHLRRRPGPRPERRPDAGPVRGHPGGDLPAHRRAGRPHRRLPQEAADLIPRRPGPRPRRPPAAA